MNSVQEGDNFGGKISIIINFGLYVFPAQHNILLLFFTILISGFIVSVFSLCMGL